MRRAIGLRELEFRLGTWFRQINGHSSTQQSWAKRLPMPMEISLSQSMLLRSTCSLPVLIISLGRQRHLSVPPCVSFSVASDYDRSSNQSLQHSHSPRESPIPVPRKPIAFHPPAQRNAFRRDVRLQSRSFGRENQSLRHTPQLQPALLRFSAMISQSFIWWIATCSILNEIKFQNW
jgi:hypothetical protein